MKKTLILFSMLLLFCVCNFQNANAQRKIFTTITCTGSDTLDIGGYTDIYFEAYNGSADSSRTFTVADVTRISGNSVIPIGVIDMTAGTSMATIVQGTLTLTLGQRKIFKVAPEMVNSLVFTNTSARNNIKFKVWGVYKLPF